MSVLVQGRPNLGLISGKILPKFLDRKCVNLTKPFICTIDRSHFKNLYFEGRRISRLPKLKLRYSTVNLVEEKDAVSNYSRQYLKPSEDSVRDRGGLRGCKSPYELVEAINKLGALSRDDLQVVRTKAEHLASSDMKGNAVLLITLNEFKLDSSQFLEKLKRLEWSENEHVIIRSLAESAGIELDQEIVNKINDKFNSYFGEIETDKDQVESGIKEERERVNELYNYVCSYCKFFKRKLVQNYRHLITIEGVMREHKLQEFTTEQLVDVCYHLALVKSEVCREVLEVLNLRNFYKNTPLSDQIHLFSRAIEFDELDRFEKLESRLLEMYEKEDLELSLEDCLNLIVAIGRGRRTEVRLVDQVVENVKTYTEDLELEQITKILINLSKVNYNNRSFIRHLSNLIMNFVDEDSIVDPYLLSDMLKSFGRFKYCNEKLLKILLEIVVKEEVLANVETHDLVTIFRSVTKICGMAIPGTIRPTKVKLNRSLKVITRKIMEKEVNTETAVKLVVSSGRIEYENERFLNWLVELINLKEIQNLTTLHRLKINVDKLGIYYPELEGRIREIEEKLEPEKASKLKEEEAEEEAGERCTGEGDTETDRRGIVDYYVRRRPLYNHQRLASVRKRKWTY